MTETSNTIALDALPQLKSLFDSLNGGRHLNRHHDTALWVELEQQQASYQALFAALGHELRIDGRGFAWFHGAEASSNVSKSSRRLALLLMLLFEFQADQGQHLGKFHAWTIDGKLLQALWEKNQALLEAEDMADTDALVDVLNTGVRYGFMHAAGSQWRLLPAVYRYLDYFEELAARRRQQQVTDQSVTARDEVL